MRISKSRPTPPVGRYPHFRLWPQVGSTPSRARTKAVIKAVHDFGGVPVPEPFFAEENDHGLLVWAKLSPDPTRP